jgi:spermidine synthase
MARHQSEMIPAQQPDFLLYFAHMSWLHEVKTFESAKNGRITCRRSFGRWSVLVGGAQESSPYLTGMWRDALKRLPHHAQPRRILMFGLAAGGCLALLQRRWPHAEVTVIEWDPVMIRVFEAIGPRGARKPLIIEGEAGASLKDLEGPYDLIVVDLFTGHDAASPIKDPSFYAGLRRLIAPTGFLLVNLYREAARADLIRRDFQQPEVWTRQYNTLALSQPPLPDSYVPYRQDPAFLKREFAGNRRFRFLAERPGAMRWNFGPFWFESWHGDEAPAATAGGPKRIVLWQRSVRRDVPAGWRPVPPVPPPQLTGFAVLDARWLEAWTPHARRHLNRWRRETDWEIVETDLETFLAAYRRAPIKPSIRSTYAAALRQKIRLHGPDRLHLLGARKRGADGIAAGFAFLDIPESSQSLHVASFVNPEAEGVAAGVGLIEAWFRHGLDRKLSFLDFDLFWTPGDPRDRRGFSRFKSQFGVRFVRHPRLLYRLTGNWKEVFSASPRG